MYILYDGPFVSDPKGGVVRYFHKIANNLARENRVGFTRRDCISGLDNLVRLPPFSHFRPHRISFLIELFWYKFFSRDIPDIVHPTEFGLSPTGKYFSRKGTKTVITVHDLIHEKFGAPGLLYDKKKRTTFYEEANGLIFVSKSTKNDFDHYYPGLTKSIRTEIVLHGNNFPLQANPSPNRQKQFLFVGSRNGYKNFHSAIEAFKIIASKTSDTSFIVAGPPPTKEEIKSTFPFKSRVRWVESPPDEALQCLYSESLSLLYVSKYEGFGMPLLEAMSRGCIPIAGNHSSIPEVLKGAGIQTDITDPTAIAHAMMKCNDDHAFTNSKRLAGTTTSKGFTWTKSSSQTLDFYNSL